MASVGDFFWSNFSNFYDFLPSHNSQMALIKQMFKADVKKITREEPMETPLGDGFTIYSGSALGSDSVAEFAARELGMNVEIKIPPGHPRACSVSPLTPRNWMRQTPMWNGLPKCSNGHCLSIPPTVSRTISSDEISTSCVKQRPYMHLGYFKPPLTYKFSKEVLDGPSS